MENFKEAAKRIDQIIRECRGDSDRFAETLRGEEIPHLSFSQVATVEFCEHRYYLQYIEKEEPVPFPDYFTKGKLLHQLIAETYEAIRTGSENGSVSVEYRIANTCIGDNKRHLVNAYHVHQANLWAGFKVADVEHPFVMEIDEKLPPMVGVIDLVLKQNGQYFLVDHKSGRNFYPYDELQVAIYKKYIQAVYQGADCRLYYDHYRWVNNLEKYIQAVYQGADCRLYYDHYRWVNNLGRIRKPAFQRTEVSVDVSSWPSYLKRIQQAYAIIQRIKNGIAPSRGGECFRCPYRNNC